MNHHLIKSTQQKEAWSVFDELEPADCSADKAEKVQSLFPPPQFLSVGGNVKVTIVSFATMHQYGDLLPNFLRARKKVFIDELHWELPTTEGMEFDQYDTPFARWLIVHEYGEILGGLRLSPTTAQCGIYSYMLRDAQEGILENIPTDVLHIKAPVKNTVWEGTRLFICDSVSASRRLGIQYLLIRNLLSAAKELGAEHLIGFVPSHWHRWIRRMGLQAVAIGPKIEIEGSVSQAALMKVL